LGIRQHVLRYWEEQFPMLSPVKRSGNRRYYRPEDVAMIETIDRLVHREGYTLRGARLALDASPKKPQRATAASPANGSQPQSPASLPEPGSILAELLSIRAKLATALAA
jgi:DNA-binding transcriptional MerR regulator